MATQSTSDLERAATRPASPQSDTSSSTSLADLEKVPHLTTESLPPVDVGLTPWLQVLGGFMLVLNSWGIIVSFGVFQNYYTSSDGIANQSSPSTIAWIGSIQAFLLMFGGMINGGILDAGYFRPVMYIGAFMVVFGTMMISIATQYYQFILAQAVCVGGGTGLFVTIGLSITATWFSKHRGLAMGIIASASSVAGIIYPIMFQSLVPRLGFAWAVRIQALTCLVTLIVPLIVMRTRVPPRKQLVFIEFTALREPTFALFILGNFVTFLGFFTFYGFVEEWLVSSGIDTHGLPVTALLPIINAVAIPGRIIPAYLSDYLGPLNVQAPCTIIAGIMTLCWIPVQSITGLLVVAVIYGFFSGAIIALSSTTIPSLTEDLSTLGGRFGAGFTAMAFASLIGNPVTGAIIESQHGGYDGARAYSGVCLIIGGAIWYVARFVKTGPKLWAKA